MLMNNYIEAIKKREELRKNLIALRSELKEEEQRKALAYYLAGDFSVFTDLLADGDPKVRKNAVLILGDMECDDMCSLIWDAYEHEETLFVKADYIKALSRLECASYVKQMKARMEELSGKKILPQEEKHLRNEYLQLKSIVMRYERPAKHKFTGYNYSHEIILLTNRNHREVTRKQLSEERVKLLAGGMRFRTDRLKEILQIRTYSEMLFTIGKSAPLEGNPEHMAEQILDAGLIGFLAKNHEGLPPFYFRLEVKGSMLQDQKIDLVKKLSAALEKHSKGQLLNATSGYELEIRLVGSKEGKFVPLLKMFTVPDWRFAYRKECLPTSIAPVNAALIMELSKEYLKENAQVLDPFCGVGTMLIERRKMGNTRSMYGLDILEEAVEKARMNAKEAHLTVNYINRDFFDFKHGYLFDEIVTNMPAIGKSRDAAGVAGLYKRFLDKVPEVVKPGAVIVVYSAMHEIFTKYVRERNEYKLLQNYCINEREGSYVHVIRYEP